jgi:hypothetical protein
MSTSLVSFLADFADYFPYPKLQALGLLVLIGLIWFLIWNKRKQM